jgi:hypothetical protein
MKIIKRTKTKTDILNMKDGSRVFIHSNTQNEVDDKYRDEILESILYKTGGIKILESRVETIGTIKPVESVDLEREALIKEALDLGLKVHHKTKNEKIKELIEEAKASTNSDEDSTDLGSNE